MTTNVRSEMEAWAADVDAFFGVVGGSAGDVVYRASARDRLAGRWLGCYAQPVAAFGSMWMDFELDVRDAGPRSEVQADGFDGLGRFTIAGHVDSSSGDARLAKQYVGAHGVKYEGVLVGRAIRGVWSAGIAEGVFALWNAESLAPADIARGARSVKSRGHELMQLAALVTSPLRVVTLLRHGRLVSRFRRLRGAAESR